MGLDKLVRSKGYKNFMAKLYGWGASVVILGALFKIMHYPGAGVMLLAGMGTEAIIFFMSAFEPLHVEYNWALVYPELAVGDEAPIPDKKGAKKLPAGATPTQQLDKMLEDAKVGPELIESLATGMRNLSENAKKLSGVADAATVTDNYVGNLTKAAESVRNLSLEYDKTTASLQKDSNVSGEYLNNVQKASAAVANLANIYENTTKAIQGDTGAYNDQLKKLNTHLSAINSNTYAQNLNDSLANTKVYKEEIDKLTKNVARLSSVYGNMVAAMSITK